MNLREAIGIVFLAMAFCVRTLSFEGASDTERAILDSVYIGFGMTGALCVAMSGYMPRFVAMVAFWACATLRADCTLALVVQIFGILLEFLFLYLAYRRASS